MNQIPATVTQIRQIDNLTVVGFESSGIPMRMMSLGMNTPIRIGSEVILGMKASNVALAKQLQGDLSISNKLETTVKSIRQGELLCSVKLDFNGSIIESIITMDSARSMQLDIGDRVLALIKSSELAIIKVV